MKNAKIKMENDNAKLKMGEFESGGLDSAFPTRYPPYPTSFPSGFTIIELLVTVSIFALISSVLLANYPKFSSKILLENTAHSIGLSVRVAQTFGQSVRGVKVSGADVFPTHGIHFSLNGINEIDPADRKHFVLFADILPNSGTPTENNKIYDAISNCTVTGGECIDTLAIQSTEQIVLLCGDLKSKEATIENWAEKGADCGLESLDIAFTRPNPDASIKGKNQVSGEEVVFTDGEIVVQSPRGDYKTVIVWSTGQISVE